MSEINDSNRLGNNIRALRIFYGESQKNLAAHLFVNRNTISHYENGKRTPNDKTILAIAKHYMVSVDELLHCDFTGLKRIRYDDNKIWQNIDLFFPILSPDSALNNEHFKKAYLLHKEIYEKIKKWNSNPSSINLKCFQDMVVCYNEYEEAFINSFVNMVKNHDETISDEGVLAGLNQCAIRNLFLSIFNTFIILSEESPAILKNDMIDNDIIKMTKDPNIYNDVTQIITDIKSKNTTRAYQIALRNQKWSDLAYYYISMEYYLKIADCNSDHNIKTLIGTEMLTRLASLGNDYAKRFLKSISS